MYGRRMEVKCFFVVVVFVNSNPERDVQRGRVKPGEDGRSRISDLQPPRQRHAGLPGTDFKWSSSEIKTHDLQTSPDGRAGTETCQSVTNPVPSWRWSVIRKERV